MLLNLMRWAFNAGLCCTHTGLYHHENAPPNTSLCFSASFPPRYMHAHRQSCFPEIWTSNKFVCSFVNLSNHFFPQGNCKHLSTLVLCINGSLLHYFTINKCSCFHLGPFHLALTCIMKIIAFYYTFKKYLATFNNIHKLAKIKKKNPLKNNSLFTLKWLYWIFTSWDQKVLSLVQLCWSLGATEIIKDSFVSLCIIYSCLLQF